MKSITINKLKKQADKWFSYYIRMRDQNECFICGKKMDFPDSQAGHLISRTATAIRWDETNVFCSCPGCNFYHEHRPEIMTNLYIERFGVDKYQQLYYRSKQLVKLTRVYLNDLIATYREKYEELITRLM